MIETDKIARPTLLRTEFEFETDRIFCSLLPNTGLFFQFGGFE
jgi:hypothetical protein